MPPVDIEKFGTMKPKESSKGSVEKDAAQDILDSVKDGDVESLRLALKLFVKECYAQGEEAEEDDE